MLDQLRDHMSMYLTAHDVCILIPKIGDGMGALPVRYRNHGLELECLIPAWADVVYYLEQNPAVLVLVPDLLIGATRWLAYDGTARFTVNTGNTGEVDGFGTGDVRYRLVRIDPRRIDLIDQCSHWGARTTLEM